MTPERHAQAIVALLAVTDPADQGTVPASVVYAVLTYCVSRYPEVSRLGDYGLRRLADALVIELATPPTDSP